MYEILYQDIEEKKEYEEIANKVLTKCFQEEGLENTKFMITILLTTPKNIQEINKRYRNVDQATDVLSFPMFERDELTEKIQKKDFWQEDILGDIIISIEKVLEQAEEYEHSFEREFSYMLVHGFYHLVGYDHMQEEEKAKMRTKEENILANLGIDRN